MVPKLQDAPNRASGIVSENSLPTPHDGADSRDRPALSAWKTDGPVGSGLCYHVERPEGARPVPDQTNDITRPECRSDANTAGRRPSKGVMQGVPPRTQWPNEGTDSGVPSATETDSRWVRKLIDEHGPGILRMLWRMLGREQDVLDAYQDCFCNLVGRRNPSGLKNAKAYAYRTASNIAVEIIRGRRRQAAHWEGIAQTRSQHADREEAGAEIETDRDDQLRAALGRLPTHLRNVVVLRDLSHMSYKDVGRTLGIEPSTARVYRRHAVVKLAEILDQGTES